MGERRAVQKFGWCWKTLGAGPTGNWKWGNLRLELQCGRGQVFQRALRAGTESADPHHSKWAPPKVQLRQRRPSKSCPLFPQAQLHNICSLLRKTLCLGTSVRCCEPALVSSSFTTHHDTQSCPRCSVRRPALRPARARLDMSATAGFGRLHPSPQLAPAQLQNTNLSPASNTSSPLLSRQPCRSS